MNHCGNYYDIVYVKVIVHSKMSMLSSFSNHQVVSNQYEFLLLNAKQDILKNVGNQTVSHGLTLSINYTFKFQDCLKNCMFKGMCFVLMAFDG